MNADGDCSSGHVQVKGLTKRSVVSDIHNSTKRNKTEEKGVVELSSVNPPSAILTNSSPTRTADIKSHLAIFKQCVRSPSDLTESSDDGSEWECFKPPEERKVTAKEELRVGDIVIFYCYPATHGDLRALTWATVTSISSYLDDDDDFDAALGVDSWEPLSYHHNQVRVYRHDEANILQDATRGRFRWMSNMHLVEGELRNGTNTNGADRLRKIMRRSQSNYNEKLVIEGIIENPEEGPSLGIKAASTKDDNVLNDIMGSIINQMKVISRAYIARKEYREAMELKDKGDKVEASKQNKQDAVTLIDVEPIAPEIIDLVDCETTPMVLVDERIDTISTASFRQQQVSALQASMDDNSARTYPLYCHL